MVCTPGHGGEGTLHRGEVVREGAVREGAGLGRARARGTGTQGREAGSEAENTKISYI